MTAEMPLAPSPTRLESLRSNPRRVRLVASLSIYGAGLGAAALLISLLAQTRFPKVPEHMDFVPTVIFSLGGALVGLVLAGLLTFWTSRNADEPRNFLIFPFVGFAFGVLLPFFTGAVLPTCTLILNVVVGVTGGGEFASQLVSAVFRAPSFMFVHGVFGLFTGMLAGAFFAGGSLIIDQLNTTSNEPVSRYAPYVVAVVLAVTVVAIAAYGPAPELAKLS